MALFPKRIGEPLYTYFRYSGMGRAPWTTLLSSHCFAPLPSSLPYNWSAPGSISTTTYSTICCTKPWPSSRQCDPIVPIVTPPGSFIGAKPTAAALSLPCLWQNIQSVTQRRAGQAAPQAQVGRLCRLPAPGALAEEGCQGVRHQSQNRLSLAAPVLALCPDHASIPASRDY